MNRKMIFATVAMASLICASAVQAATVQVQVQGTSAGQLMKGPVSQAASASAAANGEVRNNSNAKATAVALGQSADVAHAIKGETAAGQASTGSTTGTLGVSASAAGQAAGEAEAAEFAMSPFGASGAMNASAWNQAWNGQSSLNGSFGSSYSVTPASFDLRMSDIGISQVMESSLNQSANAVASSGGVYDGSATEGLGATIGQTITVDVDFSDCNC